MDKKQTIAALTPLDKAIAGLQRDLDVLNEERDRVVDRYLEFKSGIKVGDNITWGKKQNLRGRVVDLQPWCGIKLDDIERDTVEIDYWVVNVRKDGTEGERHKIHHWDRPTLAKP